MSATNARSALNTFVRPASLLAVLLFLMLLAACGGGSSKSTTPGGGSGGAGGNTGGGGGNTPTVPSGFVYVANTGSNNVSALGVNPQTSAVTAVSGSPFAVATFPVSIASSGNFVFVASSGDLNGTDPSKYRITTFTVDTNTGALTQTSALTYPTTIAAGAPVELKVDPAGKFLYVVLGGAGGFATFSINGTTGALTEIAGSPNQPVGFGVLRHPAITPDGKLMYMTGDIGPRAPEYSFVRFVRDPATGTLDPNYLIMSADGFVQSMAITPDGKFLLAAVPSAPINSGGQLGPLNAVSVYSIATDGMLTKVPGEPFMVGSGPQSLVIDPSGKYVLVANHDSNNVSVMSIGTNGVLTPVAGAPFTAGTGPVSIAMSASGKYVFVANAGSNDVSGYSFDATTGALTPLTGSPFAAGTSPAGVVTSQF